MARNLADSALLIGFETRLSKVNKEDRSATMLIHLRQDLLGGVSHTGGTLWLTASLSSSQRFW